MESVGIIGLGWLGKALAFQLISDEYAVQGTATSQEKIDKLNAEGISALQFLLGGNVPPDLLNKSMYVVTIPPRGSDYVVLLCQLAQQLPVNAKILYISSTSVYPDNNREVTEKDAMKRISPHSSIALLDAEKAIASVKNPCTIIRMAGLYGPDRHPGRFMANKTNVAGAENPVNLVHLDDCIGIIHTVIKNSYWNEVINACSDEHPSRTEFYTKATELIGEDAPVFSDEKLPFKIVDNSKSKNVLGYSYKHPDPLTGLLSI